MYDGGDCVGWKQCKHKQIIFFIQSKLGISIIISMQLSSKTVQVWKQSLEEGNSTGYQTYLEC